MSANGRDVTKRAIIDVNSIVSGRNYDFNLNFSLNCSRHGHSMTCAVNMTRNKNGRAGYGGGDYSLHMHIYR